MLQKPVTHSALCHKTRRLYEHAECYERNDAALVLLTPLQSVRYYEAAYERHIKSGMSPKHPSVTGLSRDLAKRWWKDRAIAFFSIYYRST